MGKSFGGTGLDEAADISELPNHDLIISYNTTSSDGDVTFNHGDYDWNIMRTDSAGNIKWQKSFGGSNMDYCNTSILTLEEKILIAGFTASVDGDIVTNYGGATDAWIIQISDSGTIDWTKNFGGSAEDYFYQVVQGNLGNLYSVGLSNSDDTDLVHNHGNYDYWLLRTMPLPLEPNVNPDDTVAVASINSHAVNLFPNPSSGIYFLNGNFTYGTEVHVYNFLGEEISNLPLSEGFNILNLSSQPSGIYIAEIYKFGFLESRIKLIRN